MNHKRFYLVSVVLLLVLSLFTAQFVAADSSADDVTTDGASHQAMPHRQDAAGWQNASPEAFSLAVLYDNGPLITHPGGGSGGADASALQTALSLTVYGFGHQVTAGNRVADDFTIPAGQTWTIDQITYYAYQTLSGTGSTITAVNYQIWDGPPSDPGSTVVFGDTTTNRLTSTAWSNIYRVLDTGLTNTDRPVMRDIASAGVTLGAGDYWLDWQSNGTLASGPWVPPITILGTTVTGNALQFTPAGSWLPLVDTGPTPDAPQGLPFIIEGTMSGGATTFSATMNGDNEVPPVDTEADGFLQLMDQDTRVAFRIGLRNITSTTAGHIHCAAAGVNGPIGVTLFVGSFSGTGIRTSMFTAPDAGNGCGWVTLDDVVAAMATGDTYVNVHTVANPAGEIRGQIMPLP